MADALIYYGVLAGIACACALVLGLGLARLKSIERRLDEEADYYAELAERERGNE